MNHRPLVSLVSAHSYEEGALRQSLTQVLEPLGGMAAIVKPGDRVLLKPNLLTGSRPTKECITRTEVVACVAQMVREAGGDPFLGDSPAFGSARGVLKNNGYLPLLERLELPIVEFSGQRFPVENEELRSLRLSKEALNADVVINLPKVKSHMQLTLTLGVKNLFGCVPGKMKAWWHMELGKDPRKFALMLIETAKAIAPELTIVDGILGHEGNGPSGGEPRELGVLAAAQDVFALDRALTEILGVDPQTVPTIALAMELGLCGDLTAIDFPHATPEALKVENWQLPSTMMPIDFAMPRVIKSTFRNLYIRLIKEPLDIYGSKKEA